MRKKERILKKLYDERKERLEKCEIYIDLEQIKTFYNIK